MDVGQTVAASLSAPQLFLIAKDLSQMQILATVDESDIGQIKEGQPVSFTVQAYPGQSFTGAVRQVRLQSTTVNNVVNYTAVVAVANPDGALLPGMTATVKFLTGAATTCCRCRTRRCASSPRSPRPTARARRSARARNGTVRNVAAGAARRQHAQGTRRDDGDALVSRFRERGRAGARAHGDHRRGTRTEVTGTGLKEGMQVVIGASTGTAASAPAAKNPLQPQSRVGAAVLQAPSNRHRGELRCPNQ